MTFSALLLSLSICLFADVNAIFSLILENSLAAKLTSSSRNSIQFNSPGRRGKIMSGIFRENGLVWLQISVLKSECKSEWDFPFSKYGIWEIFNCLSCDFGNFTPPPLLPFSRWSWDDGVCGWIVCWIGFSSSHGDKQQHQCPLCYRSGSEKTVCSELGSKTCSKFWIHFSIFEIIFR